MPSTESSIGSRPDPAPVDPRPDVVEVDGVHRLVGMRCTECGYPLQIQVLVCPVCRGRVGRAYFGPEGTVWSATVLRIPMPGRPTPYVISWVDLDDGPRVIAHLDVEDAPVAGARVSLVASAPNRDLHAEVLA